MRIAAVVLIGLVLAGCGGDDRETTDQPSTPAESVLADWVKALNDRNFGRACELSATSPELPCQDLLRAAFDGYQGDIELEGSYSSSGRSLPLAFSLAAAPKGFSAGQVENVDGKPRVHWEVQIIR